MLFIGKNFEKGEGRREGGKRREEREERREGEEREGKGREEKRRGEDESSANPVQLLTGLSYREYCEINQRDSAIYISPSETKPLGG